MQVSVTYSPAEQLTSLNLVFCIYNSQSFALPQGQGQGEVNKDFALDKKIPEDTKNSVIKKKKIILTSYFLKIKINAKEPHDEHISKFNKNSF